MNAHRLPNFLIIGAMKCGTTTLCNDLGNHPNIFFPSVKEPHTLLLPNVETDRGRNQYAKLFKDSMPDQVIGEGSTGYAKYPSFKEVPKRAFNLLGRHTKIIYIIRNPVERTLSHHYHLYRASETAYSFSAAIANNPEIIEVSRYGMQISKWLKFFDRKQIKVLTLEDLKLDRDKVLKDVVGFLGCDPDALSFADKDRKVMNAGSDSLDPPAFLKGTKEFITRSQFYKREIAPYLSNNVKSIFKNILYRRTGHLEPGMPTRPEIDNMVSIFSEDQKLLQELLDNTFYSRQMLETVVEKRFNNKR